MLRKHIFSKPIIWELISKKKRVRDTKYQMFTKYLDIDRFLRVSISLKNLLYRLYITIKEKENNLDVFFYDVKICKPV